MARRRGLATSSDAANRSSIRGTNRRGRRSGGFIPPSLETKRQVFAGMHKERQLVSTVVAFAPLAFDCRFVLPYLCILYSYAQSPQDRHSVVALSGLGIDGSAVTFLCRLSFPQQFRLSRLPGLRYRGPRRNRATSSGGSHVCCLPSRTLLLRSFCSFSRFFFDFSSRSSVALKSAARLPYSP